MVALTFPGSYRAGMSSLGFQTILYAFASIREVTAQRVFLEEGGALSLLDSAVHPRQVDLFAFSVSAENDYPSLLRALSLAGFPLRAKERDATYPLVLAGGIAPSLNPEPLADFLDLVALGEGENILPSLVEKMRGWRDAAGGKEGLLGELTVIEGLYVPLFYQPSYEEKGCLKGHRPRRPGPDRVSRAWIRDLDHHPAVTRIVAPGSEFENLFLVEINRGCGRGCRFCAAGHLCRPLRHRSLSSLVAAIEKGSETLERFGLLGSAVSDYPDIIALAQTIVDRGWKFSVSSLRVDRLRPDLLRLLYLGGCRTVTLAPETGSERLRWAVNKPIGDDLIFQAVEAAAAAGIPNVKLYFMIGLPTETDEDRKAIPALLRKVRHHFVAGSRERRRIGAVSVSMSCFVPKAWTPFQWHPFQEVGQLKRALALLSREIRKIPNVTATHDLPKWAYVQALLSRGDRRTADILEDVHRRDGDWRRALRESSVNSDFFVYRPREEKELFPWDFVDTGLDKSLLWKQYRRATAGEAGTGR